MPVNWTVISVVLSTYREDSRIVEASLQSLIDEPLVSSVHVWGGFIPTRGPKVHEHSLFPTLYHAALEQHFSNVTADVLCRNQFKWCASDAPKRVRWRATLSLNMWQVLSAARQMFPSNVLMYTENDAVAIPGRLEVALGAMQSGGFAASSCYQPQGSRGDTFEGSGNVCFLLTPKARPEGHLLGYHLVEPADWIISDYSRSSWPIIKVVTHGIAGQAHKSTFNK